MIFTGDLWIIALKPNTAILTRPVYVPSYFFSSFLFYFVFFLLMKLLFSREQIKMPCCIQV